MMTQSENGQHRIVVGVDGSVPSKAALAWALGQARLSGAAVEAVTAWETPVMTGYPVPVPDVDWEYLATSQHCVHHATCPVVLIRDSGTGRPAEAERG